MDQDAAGVKRHGTVARETGAPTGSGRCRY